MGMNVCRVQGMVDPGEEVSATLLREFLEEAVNFKMDDVKVLTSMNREQKLNKIKDLFFNHGTEVTLYASFFAFLLQFSS